MTSAWLTAATTLPLCAATISSTASTARSCAARIVSPSGNSTSDGRSWMTGHSFVRDDLREGRSVQRP
jgi:hypothetical protein